MAAEIQPSVDTWYRAPGGDPFEVVAIDRQDRTIEIQYADGTVEELDLEDWYNLGIVAVAPPADALACDDIDDDAELYHREEFNDFDNAGFSDWASTYDDYD